MPGELRLGVVPQDPSGMVVAENESGSFGIESWDAIVEAGAPPSPPCVRGFCSSVMG